MYIGVVAEGPQYLTGNAKVLGPIPNTELMTFGKVLIYKMDLPLHTQEGN